VTLLWQAGPSGRFLLSTTRLPERNRPYNLNLELARAQVARIAVKHEEWGLFDFATASEISAAYDRLRRRLVEAIKIRDGAKASVLADTVLAEAVTLGEKMALFHGDVLLQRRRASNIRRCGFGCTVDISCRSRAYAERIGDGLDFISVPVPWKHTEPREREYDFSQVDLWVQWAQKVRKAVHLGPILSFDAADLPEWLYIWEHDYESLRDLIYEHVQQIAQRYAAQASVIRVVSGINVFNSFSMSFEQIMELTRMCCLLVKRVAPRSTVLIDLVMPWGEYYARNQRTIPPMLYADMVVQSGIKFDAFGVQISSGLPKDGFYVRDLLQISSLLDEFLRMGKGVHVTACQVPSSCESGPDGHGKKLRIERAGQWHNPWSPRLQAEWLQAFLRTAISKPFVETVCWRDLADGPAGFVVPHGGLCEKDLKPKLAYRELRNFKNRLIAEQQDFDVLDQQRPDPDDDPDEEDEE
jgi:hypothetical protein